MSQSKLKKWVINLLILLVVTIVMVAIAETAMRWLDGYQLSTFELEQQPGGVEQVK